MNLIILSQGSQVLKTSIQHLLLKMAKPEDQIINLMDLLKIPEEKRNFNELRNRIQNLIQENDNADAND